MTTYVQKNGPIFIVGAPRSGTTLLQYMLRSHPRISLPTGESHFVIPLYRNQDSFGDLSRVENIRRVLDEMYRRSADYLDTDLHGIRFDMDSLAEDLTNDRPSTIADIVRGLLARNARGEGKVRWGDKTPYYVLHIPTILAMFPDAQIIHIIRDGRDCALSMFNRCHDFGVYNIYHAAKYWEQYVVTGQTCGRSLPPDVYIEVRYEDLIAEPERRLSRLCQFLGEEYSDVLVNFKKAGQPGKTPLLQRPVQENNAEKWRTALTRRQIRIFEAAAGEVLRANDYPIATSALRLPLALRAAFRVHNRIATGYYNKIRLMAR